MRDTPTWPALAVCSVLLVVGLLLAILGGTSVAATLHDRTREQSTCTVIDRRIVSEYRAKHPYPVEDVRLRLQLRGGTYEHAEWVRFDGGRPEVGTPVDCYYDPQRPQDIVVSRTAFGAEVPVTLFGGLFVVLAIVGILALLEVGAAVRRAQARRFNRSGRRHRAAPATEPVGDPYRAGTTLGVRLRGAGEREVTALERESRWGWVSLPVLFMLSLVVADGVPAVAVLLWGLAVLVVVLPLLASVPSRRRARRDLPVVEIDREPAILGSELAIHVKLVGPIAVEATHVEIEAEKDGVKAVEASAAPVNAEEGRRTLASGETWERRWSTSLPDRASLDDVLWAIVLRLQTGEREHRARYRFRAVGPR